MVSRRTSQSQHLRSNLMRNVTERSNGESALSLFVDAIQDNALYLLDEPENSLSPSNQLELKYFLEDCVKNHGCQFIISTHSPFLLALQGAKIYDIESVPMQIRKWTDLECVKVYQQFFEEKSFFVSLVINDINVIMYAVGIHFFYLIKLYEFSIYKIRI